MAKPKGKDFRAAVREAIKKDGLGKTAERVGVQEDTLQRYAFHSANSHKGTIALIEKAFT